MGQEESYLYSWSPIGAPLNIQREEDHWRQFDNSVNAVSFGFVATAILISMFLMMAIFERFLRPNSSPTGPNYGDLESQLSFNGKLRHPSPNVSHPLLSKSIHRIVSTLQVSDMMSQAVSLWMYGSKVHASLPRILSWKLSAGWICLVALMKKLFLVFLYGVSVLMPGDEIPTFIAHPAPVPCPPECSSLVQHQHYTSGNPVANSSGNIHVSAVEEN
ncbi:hypothetical protein Godav_004393 [Gossypium davidsonii]|uniref:Uncharacterized protein n=2 Tax=Gossypium TaxID=3633 RepID=A0A7J8SL43_GOSDV|nr:hypothetical protein [Gossypium davidsonii]MBA0662414.1 hypothetical protein [Gossypium klotzschianum]